MGILSKLFRKPEPPEPYDRAFLRENCLQAIESRVAPAEVVKDQIKPCHPCSICPNCGHRFIAWRVWQITRWSAMKCSNCGVPLVRKMDARQILVSLPHFALFIQIVLFPQPILLQVGLCMIAMITGFFLDAVTVRFVIAGRWRGVLGYEG